MAASRWRRFSLREGAQAVPPIRPPLSASTSARQRSSELVRVRVQDVLVDSVTLVGSSAHYLARVLRLQPGALVHGFDGQGSERPLRIVGVEGTKVRLEAAGVVERTPSAPLSITLLQALARGDRMPLIVRASTELGVARIVPILTERAVCRPEGSRGEHKAARLRRIASEAARQCGRADVPHVDDVHTLAEALALPLVGLRLALWERETLPLADVLTGESHDSVVLLVGPEGGLSKGEVGLARDAEFLTVSLGSRILRTETVAPVLLAIVQHLWGDLGR